MATIYQLPEKRPDIQPWVYAFRAPDLTSHSGFVKVGYTERSVGARVHEISGSLRVRLDVLGKWSAVKKDGSTFDDKAVHKVLERRGFARLASDQAGAEWFRCSVQDVESAIDALVAGTENELTRTLNFKMRPEQLSAVAGTQKYFKNAAAGTIPKFLWNCKMRFGKTFAAYQLARQMGFKKVLILTFKPAVQSAWREDLERHVDFEGWQFLCRESDFNYESVDKTKPLVCFGSFQDFLGRDAETGGIKAKNSWVHETHWDLVIFDEYHFGAWRENARNLFAPENEEKEFDPEEYQRKEGGNAFDESFLPISTNYYLYLSGTPFRAINTGEFVEDQIYNWTYADEQRAKTNWDESKGKNPYAALPRMVMMTYRVPDAICAIASEGEFNGFDLNEFFATERDVAGTASFKHKNEVQKWLDLIRGAYLPSNRDDLHLGVTPPMPYSDSRLLSMLTHTLWFLPDVGACEAMQNLLRERQNTFYHDYEVVCCAGSHVGCGSAALPPVINAMNKNGKNPLETKTITLSCGKLTTGVTVRPWTGIFMLRNLKSAETYFQAAFRVQSPWETIDGNGEKQIIKQDCYVFDFSLDRALKQIADYSCQLNIKETNPAKKVGDFINFLPVLAYDGAKMTQINEIEILDFVAAGTTSTLLARRWESALLVNVKDDVLKSLQASPEAMAALEKIEAFRNLRQDIETIINKSDAVKKMKKEGIDGNPDEKEKKKKELSDEEKKMKSKRKEIQEKLIKLATRIPIFMYLTDDREHALKDVIRSIDKKLFTKVTGLTIGDFELLCTLNVFNSAVMNDAIYKFKRYEDASLEYMGINKHGNEIYVGGFDSAISKEEYQILVGGKPKEIVFNNVSY